MLNSFRPQPATPPPAPAGAGSATAAGAAGMQQRCVRRRTPGQALVEFALVSVVLMALLMGAIEVGRVLFVYMALVGAAREGARVGAVCQDTAQIQTYAQNTAPSVTLTTTVSYLTSAGAAGGSAAAGNHIMVTASASYSPIAPVLVGPFNTTITLTTSNSARIDSVVTTSCP